ncbi:hypothetical protein NDU88_005836 [Pleurodeles waltl]|uniref:Uncharacterized protein n=1 Tax=Pleurodeles waltl TaxID=8319 RepID=A0AAV7TBW6_PLEWA|nr:hypothetical protein NDU88_005836 [Pleurodeles waltl]
MEEYTVYLDCLTLAWLEGLRSEFLVKPLTLEAITAAIRWLPTWAWLSRRAWRTQARRALRLARLIRCCTGIGGWRCPLRKVSGSGEDSGSGEARCWPPQRGAKTEQSQACGAAACRLEGAVGVA